MKFQVGNTPIHIEVGQYKPMDKGALKAFFAIVEYPQGRKTLECRYFQKGDQRWFSFPQKEYKKAGSDKSEYIPLISYLDKEYFEQFKAAVLIALKDQEDNHGQANSYQKQAAPLQDDASSLWF